MPNATAGPNMNPLASIPIAFKKTRKKPMKRFEKQIITENSPNGKEKPNKHKGHRKLAQHQTRKDQES
ncbi:serine hydroxymethyltransferase [Sesbania bispinosa]|nr:serine hydroxymethyltransferase [Sesbania bispinosa]